MEEAEEAVAILRSGPFRGPILVGVDCEFIQEKDLAITKQKYVDSSLPACKGSQVATIAWITIASPFGPVYSLHQISKPRAIFDVFDKFLSEEGVIVAAHNWRSDSLALTITYGPKGWPSKAPKWTGITK